MNETLPGGFLERLAANCPDGIIYADAAGKIRFWNRSATRIFGYEADEALGQTLDLIVPVRDSAGAMLGIAAFLRDTTKRFEELRALRRELAALKGQVGHE